MLNSEKLFIDLYFEIKIQYNSKKIKLQDFQYSLKRSNFFNIKGELKKDSLLISEDNNFYIYANTDTTFYNLNGNKVETIFLKLREKKFDNLENSIVISNVVYEVLPDNILLDNPLTIGIKLRKQDLNFNDTKRLKIAWYDKKSDLWRAYKNYPVEEDDIYYYYKAEVEHFTPVAVVDCGNDELIQITMSNIYRHPIDPVYINFWVSFDEEGKLYLLPELMQNATCIFPDLTKFYNVNNNIQKCENLIKDWDEDDKNKDYQNINSYEYYDTNNKIITDNNLINDNTLKETCYNLCIVQVQKDLKCFFNNECDEFIDGIKVSEGIEVFTDNEAFWFDPYAYKINKEGTEIKLISGDGIKDTASLKCQIENREGSNQITKCLIKSDDFKKELIDTSALNNYPKINKIESSIYATPKTYGYENPVSVGGKGYFEFEIKDNGDACVNEILNADAFFGVKGNEKKFDNEIKFKNDDNICNSNTECVFNLNDENQLSSFSSIDTTNFEKSKLHSGLNYVSVDLINNKDQQAIAQGYLILKGNLKLEQEQEKLNKITSDGSSGLGSGGGSGGSLGAAGGGEYTGQMGEIFEGVSLETYQEYDSVYYLVKVDLSKAKDLSFLVTEKIAPNVMTTTEFSSKNNAQISINGGGFDIGGSNEVNGYASYQGNAYSNEKIKGDDASICFSKDNKIAIGIYNCNKLPEIYYAVTGFQRVLEKGEIPNRFSDKNNPDHKESNDIKDPRTSFGIKLDEVTNEVKEINIIIVDGRSEISNGVNMVELAELHKKHGSTDAVNLDGGGSSTLVINKGKPEIVNIPSDGNERAVANHIGIKLSMEKGNFDQSLSDCESPNTGINLLNKRDIKSGISVGSQPTKEGYDYLKSQGYKTILDVQGCDNSDKIEGIKYVHIPYDNKPPSENWVNSVVSAMQDSNNYPIYLHCMWGSHRTGVAIMLYRMKIENKCFEDAKNEFLNWANPNVAWTKEEQETLFNNLRTYSSC